jgi:hypothetical protein
MYHAFGDSKSISGVGTLVPIEFSRLSFEEVYTFRWSWFLKIQIHNLKCIRMLLMLLMMIMIVSRIRHCALFRFRINFRNYECFRAVFIGLLELWGGSVHRKAFTSQVSTTRNGTIHSHLERDSNPRLQCLSDRIQCARSLGFGI